MVEPKKKDLRGIFYIPKDFISEWNKFELNCNRDPKANDRRLKKMEGKKSVMIRHLIKGYNKMMDEKYGDLTEGQQ